MARVLWLAWWGGTILVVLSWIHLAPLALGWLGFFVGCASTVAGVIIRKAWRMPPGGR